MSSKQHFTATMIPFIQSLTLETFRYPLKVKTVTRQLGASIYPRLNAIYINLIEAIAFTKNDYLAISLSSDLAKQIKEKRSKLRQLGFKLKLNQPKKPLRLTKNIIMPEKVWKNQQTYLQVSSNIYFGKIFDSDSPTKLKPSERQLKVGQFRYLIYDKEKSLLFNLKSMYQDQIYQFHVRVQSNRYIKLMDINNKNVLGEDHAKLKSNYDEDLDQDTVITEMVLRSSSSRFDWVVVDINGIMAPKVK